MRHADRIVQDACQWLEGGYLQPTQCLKRVICVADARDRRIFVC